MGTSTYWLARWLDENDLRSAADAKHYLSDAGHVEALRTAAIAAPSVLNVFENSREHAILAGRIIDLSGDMACYSSDCLRKDVDTLFSHVWHYFDTIVVVGLDPERAIDLFTQPNDKSVQRFLAFVETFLYIRQIGAEDILVFQEKPPACSAHLRRHAQEYCATSALKQRKQWVKRMSSDSNTRIDHLRRHDDHWHYDFWHPQMEHMMPGILWSTSERPDAQEVLGGVFDTYASKLISDIGAARASQVPLGAVSAMHKDVLASSHPSIPSAEDVLFSLDLPVIRGIPARELIAIRNQNWQYFNAFQLAVRSAANDLIANATDEATATSVARQIESDVIEPELIRIRRNLRIAADSLTVKSAVGFPLSALGTAIGLLDQLPTAATVMASTVAVAGLAAFLSDYKKYVDEKGGVRASDMYFLWEAQRVAARRRGKRRLHTGRIAP